MKLKVLLDKKYFKVTYPHSIVYICCKSKFKDIHYERFISYIDILYIKRITIIVERNHYFVERNGKRSHYFVETNGWIQIPIIDNDLKNISPVSEKTFYKVIRNYNNIGNKYDCKIPNS